MRKCGHFKRSETLDRCLTVLDDEVNADRTIQRILQYVY
jgi:hypothetical protein